MLSIYFHSKLPHNPSLLAMKTKLFTLVLLLMSAGSFAQTADESAIKTVVEQESDAFHQRKADRALSYWAKVPYASHTYSEKGMGYVRGYEAISKVMKKVLARYPEVDKKGYKNHDYQIHITGTTAWTTYVTDAMDGTKKSQTYAGRYLEKINGVWKLVSVVNTPAP
jgi:hypothetical protein